MTFLSVNQLVEERANAHPDFPFLLNPEPDFSLTAHTFGDLLAYSCALARRYKNDGLRPHGSEERVIGILSKTGFHYIVNVLALIRLGFTVLYLSPNNSPAALCHLIKKTNAEALLIQPSFAQTAKGANDLLEAEDQPAIPVRNIVEQSSWPKGEFLEAYREPAAENRRTAFIIHSSGSTGFPKPIFITHLASLHNFAQNFNKTGVITLPLFHAHGHCTFFRSMYSVKRLCMYPAAIPLTAKNLIRIMRQVQPQAFYAVPFVLKLLAESNEGTQELAKCDIVTFGGAPCPDELGDQLVTGGVNLVAHYGMTEVGQLMTSVRDYANDKDWNWVRMTDNVRSYIRWTQHGDNVYEIVILPGWPSKVMSNNEDDSYSSKDLFMKHPTREDCFKYIGRLDDTITLVNGEKTNPVPTELRLRESPLIVDAIVFGVGRSSCGVLLLPSYDEKPELATKSEVELTKLLYPEVQRTNQFVETHAQIAADMVRVLPPKTQLPRADKGTVLRPAAYRMLADLIEDTYARADAVDGNTVQMNKEELTNFIRGLIESAMKERNVQCTLTNDTDLFGLGIDSLQSVRIRNTIQKGVDLNGCVLGQNVVYEHPTINQLVAHLNGLITGESLQHETEEEKMTRLVEKYSHFSEGHFQEDEGFDSPPMSPIVRVVVLTGATGSLGAHILKALLDQSSVERVYCLARAGNDDEAKERVKDSLRQRGFTLDMDQRVVCLASSLARKDLGLQQEMYQEIQSSVTTVIDNAWAVNFNLGVESFETDHIAGVHHLIQLCLANTADFFFCSSISATVGLADTTVQEKHYESPSAAQSMGYARSKWVAEQIVGNAAKRTAIRAGVHRIGQLVGDSFNGKWNTTEAISLIFKSATTIGCLPSFPERPSWLPVNDAAQIIVELSLSSKDATSKSPVWHVVNSNRSSTWDDIVDYFGKAGLKFEKVDQWTWLDRLGKSNPDPNVNPPMKLYPFFAEKYGSKKPRAEKTYTTALAAKTSPTCSQLKPVDQELVGKFYQSWHSEGFL